MSINPDALVETIKKAGKANTRVTATDGDKAKIEICEGGSWRTIQEGISPRTAESLVKQATQGVILG
jgi:chemotaxis methyl-accepting protein methylase